MKLIITSVATAALALTIVSCSTQERAQHSEMSLASKIENASNPDSVKAYVNSAKEHIDKLIADGDLVAAKAYLDSIQPVVEKKDPAMVHIFTPTKAEMAAEDAAEAMREGADTVASKASDLLDKTTEAAKATAKNAADKGAEIVDKTKEKGADIVDKAKDKGQDLTEKAKDAVKKAKEEAKEKAEDIRKAVDDK